MKKKILVLGTGKIGSLITLKLLRSTAYAVLAADKELSGHDISQIKKRYPQLKLCTLDLTDSKALNKLLEDEQPEAVISCLPYFLNQAIASTVVKHAIHYFDLTEDVPTIEFIKQLAQQAKSAFVPQCGLAPGMVGVIANDIMQSFTTVESAKLRVGALPQSSNNALKYALTWSTEGLINEYGNNGFAIENGQLVEVKALDAYEKVEVDGATYEAFNTSGGLGSLAELYQGKLKRMNYKTIRYPGHCEKIKFLMRDLKLNDDRDTLKRILENALPKTYQDIVFIYIVVTGEKGGEYIEENYTRKIYPQQFDELEWSAIQIATSSGVLAVMDVVLNDKSAHKGFVYQEQLPLQTVLASSFAEAYQ